MQAGVLKYGEHDGVQYGTIGASRSGEITSRVKQTKQTLRNQHTLLMSRLCDITTLLFQAQGRSAALNAVYIERLGQDIRRHVLGPYIRRHC